MIKKFFSKIGQGFRQSIQTVKEIREAKKIEKRRLCKVIYIEKNGIVHDYIGKLSANSDFLVIDNLNRLFLVDSIYNKQVGRHFVPTVFISTMFHRTIPIEALSTLNPDMVKQLNEDKPLKKFTPKDFDKTLNLNEFDNQKSFDFSGDAFTIMKSKVFEFLEDIPKRTIYFVFLIGLLLGMFLGSIMGAWVK